ncbi:MAG: T9SS type A sorting domain-containing protein [Lewinellaceae bacterium]|nr:T9SS type A sorting domain-containing protein [Lewinellaceae bacterium]
MNGNMGKLLLMRRYLGVGLVLLSLTLTIEVKAVTKTWAGGNTGDWNVDGNWSPSGVPTAADDVFILGIDNITVTIPDGYSAACASLTIGDESGSGDTNNDLVLSGSGSLSVSGNLNLHRSSKAGENDLNIGAGTVSVGGDLTFVGTGNQGDRTAKITTTSGTLNITGDLVFNGDSGSGAAVNVIDMSGGGGTLNLAGALTVTNTNNRGTLIPGTSSTFNFNGSTAQTIPIGVSSVVYNNLTTNNTSGATLSADITGSNVTGNLSIQSGTLNNGGTAITLASGKNFSVSNGATFNLTGTSSMVTVSGGGTKSFGATSTTIYSGGAQTVTAETYGNLVLSGGAAKTMPATTTTVAGNFTITGAGTSATAGAAINTTGNITIENGATFGGSSFTHNVGGNWTNNGTFTSGTSTVNFNGTSAQTIGGSSTTSFSTLNITNTNATVTANQDLAVTTAATVSSGATLNLGTNILSGAGSFTLNSGGTLGIGSADGITSGTTASGNIQVTGGRTYDTGANYTYNGSGAQNAGDGLPSTVNNLTISSGTTTLNASTMVNGTLTVSSGATLSMASGTTTTLTNSPSIPGTLNILGTATLAIGSNAFTIANLSVDGTPQADGAYCASGVGCANEVSYISGSATMIVNLTAFPIQLFYFNGKVQNNSSIHLSWRTATEQNNDYMAVERSADGAKFTELGRVKGAGTTQEPQAYTFTDYAPLRGLNYYRLRQVDYDGTIEYHQVISVLFDSKETGLGIQAFPNPVQDQLQARWAAAPDLPTTLRVLDMTGRQLATYKAAAGVGAFEVPLNVLPAGLYFLEVRQGQETGVLRFRKE